MMTDAALLPLPPHFPDSVQSDTFRAETLSLLSERTARYTMGDSTSVPIETAERLLSGILYCIELHLTREPGAALTPKALYTAGVLDARRIQKRCVLLLEQAEHTPPPVVNAGYLDTLKTIRSYLHFYDAENFADEVPADIVYPLSVPVPDTLRGVEYAAAYLRLLLSENAFLCLFPQETITPLLTRCYGAYTELLVNLFTPVAEAAVGRVFAGLSCGSLFLPVSMRRSVLTTLCTESEESAREMLLRAADSVCLSLGFVGERGKAVVRTAAATLLPRIRACTDIDFAEGIFPCSYTDC